MATTAEENGAESAVHSWTPISKACPTAREMADCHYTRQTPGHPMWTRPGYNYVLYREYDEGRALWCWWRPKWESGIVGTERKDGLRAIECTMFRREGKTDVASVLIAEAVEMLDTASAMRSLRLDAAGDVDVLLTGVSSSKTSARRGRRNRPGHCYIMAGWQPMAKSSQKADAWLCLQWSNRHRQTAPVTQTEMFNA